MSINIKKFNKLRVLAYHRVGNAQNFEKQIEFLIKNYHILNMKEFENYNQEQVFCKNPILITFDDGDISLYKNAFPILKKHGLHAIIFIITNLIGFNKPFWWDEIKYYLGEEAGEKKVWEVKKWANKERVEFIKDLRETFEKPGLVKEQLTSDQLSEMQAAGITIANHSHTHPMYDQCTQEELVAEMENSTQVFKNLGFNPDLFAYPNGNYSAKTEQVLKNFGVKNAFLFDHNINKGNINPLRISRLKVNDNTSIWKLRFILSGWHGKFLPIIKIAAKFFKK